MLGDGFGWGKSGAFGGKQKANAYIGRSVESSGKVLIQTTRLGRRDWMKGEANSKSIAMQLSTG